MALKKCSTALNSKEKIRKPIRRTCYCFVHQIRGEIEPLSLFGHLPPEISWFCKFFDDMGPLWKQLCGIKFRRSRPFPQLTQLRVFLYPNCHAKQVMSRHAAKIPTFLTVYYVAPENIPTEIVQDEDDIFPVLMLLEQLKTCLKN